MQDLRGFVPYPHRAWCPFLMARQENGAKAADVAVLWRAATVITLEIPRPRRKAARESTMYHTRYGTSVVVTPRNRGNGDLQVDLKLVVRKMGMTGFSLANTHDSTTEVLAEMSLESAEILAATLQQACRAARAAAPEA